ncbi:hypothetical protein [Bradyrhizobium sp.]|uniref:hypothetical protein n=1 Tax=Bradyrhizobium sp. TaxID=376 RepID=UPI001EB24212|nr:hypothetical protein [Bradyrhizobium sp.]MBV9985705.1 hypothetical protein [Bradyrhizobium sp.]
MRKRAAEAEAKFKRLYDAIENGFADVFDPLLKERATELQSIQDHGRADTERARERSIGRGRAKSLHSLETFASQATAGACELSPAGIAPPTGARWPCASR